ncbi:MAG: hypothetical protein FJ095_07880 [Deltaproteobacteria bacterium]|nr:hypothetical protein [Deltaproteobacteria bacterium]
MRAHLLVRASLSLLPFAWIACSGRGEPKGPAPGGTSGSGVVQQTSAGATGTSSASTSGAGGAGGGPVGPVPDEADLPVALGTCPKLISGKVTFKIPGLPDRTVELRLSTKSSTLDGPLVVVWHGDAQTPKAALDEVLGSNYVAKIMAAGGIVAAPYNDTQAGPRVWHSSEGDFKVDDDFVLFDQLVACARSEVGIDLRHIHVAGYQRGGFQAAHSAILRSGYVASAVIYSGGIAGEPLEPKTGLAYPLIVVHGGETLDVTDLALGEASDALAKKASQGAAPFTVEHFTVICDHGNGPTLPTEMHAPAYEFQTDHPFGTIESPYGKSLDPPFPVYCSIAGP